MLISFHQGSSIRVPLEGASLKVLALVPHLRGDIGSSVNEREFLRSLSELSADIIAISFDGWRISRSRIKTKRGSITVLHFPNLYFLWVIEWFIISMFISIIVSFLYKRMGLDLIYARSAPLAVPFLPLAKKVCLVVKIPGIIEGELKKGPFMYLYRLLEMKLARSGDVILAFPTKKLGEIWLRLRGGLIGNSFKRESLVLPAGVEDWVASNVDVGRIGSDTSETIRLGFIGTVSKRRGAHLLADTVRFMEENLGVRATLVVAGDGPYLTDLVAECKEKVVKCRILGRIPHERILEVLSHVDVLLLPLERDLHNEHVIPKSAMEAWCAGVPVVSTLKQIEELGGGIYAEREPRDIARAVMRALKERKSLSRRYEELCNGFKYSNIARRFLRLVSSCIRARKPALP